MELKQINHPDLKGYFINKKGEIYSYKKIIRKKGENYYRSIIDYNSQPQEIRKFVYNKGYWAVKIWVNGKQKLFLVHRLLLLTFVGLPPDGYESCHEDGDRLNLSLDNLRWDTRQANMDDRKKHGNTVCGEKMHNSKLNNLQVRIIRTLYKEIMNKDLASFFNVKPNTISQIQTRKRWTHII